jgi:hypothetical protein
MRHVDVADDGKSLGFLESLEAIFDEAAERNYDVKKEFVFIRRIIIDFLQTCGKSVAKARAGLSVTFSDLQEPQTHLGYPPSGLKLSPEQLQSLKGSASRLEFITCLKNILAAHSANVPGRKRRNNMKGPRESRKKQKPSYHDVNETTVDQNLEKNSQTRQPRTKIKVHLPRRLSIKPEGDVAPATNYTELPTTSAPPNATEEHTRMDEAMKAMDLDFASASETEPEPERRQSLVKLISGRKDLPETNDTFSSELEEQLEHHSSSDIEGMEGGSRSATPRTGSDDDESSRTERILSSATKFQAELNTIPEANWKSYARDIRKLCESDGIVSMDFERRLRKIKGILYIKEEKEAMVSGDWDRMRGVARLCAFIAELSAPDCEDVDQVRTEKWLATQLKDIRFLEKCLLTKKRVVELQV